MAKNFRELQAQLPAEVAQSGKDEAARIISELPHLKHKDYVGSVEYSKPDGVFHGTLQGVTDLVTYESDSREGLEVAFREAVEDYLETKGSDNRGPHSA